MSNQPIDEYNLLTQEQPKQEQDLNSLYADSVKEEKVMNIISQINPDNILTDIEHRIRGEKKDPYSQQWKPISTKVKPISEELVSNFMSFLGSILNQNTSLSNFSAPEINNIMDLVIEYVKSDLSVNAEMYGIRGDYPEMTRIGNIILIQVFATLKQAMNGMLSRRLFASLRMNESAVQQPSKAKELLKDMIPW